MSVVLPSARPCPPTAPDRLYTVTSGHGCAWIVVSEHGIVRAAGRLVAGWTLHRPLGTVLVAAARRGATVTSCEPGGHRQDAREDARQPVPA